MNDNRPSTDLTQLIETYVKENIDRAIAEGEIRIYYQPVVRTLTGRVCGFEALARWESKEYGFLTPDKFIPVLEESDQIHKLDCFVVRENARLYREHLDKGLYPVPVSFNLSRQDFLMEDMFAVVTEAAKAYDVPKQMMRIEITESTLAADEELISRVMERFQAAGYEVWMDDFGSGYSSLNTLKDHTFDELKIDMAFLSSFTQRSKDIITGIVQMAKKIGIRTLAEGVETAEQFAFLQDIGCELAQGYYFGRPLEGGKCFANIQEKGLQVEVPEDMGFYQEAGRQVFQEHTPMAILEYQNDRLEFLHTNTSYRALVRELGIANITDIADKLNSHDDGFYQGFRKKIREGRNSGKSSHFAFAVGSSYVTMELRIVSTMGDRCICHVLLNNTHVTVPQAAATEVTEADTERTVSGDQKPKILVVDDEQINGLLLGKMLEVEYDVLFAENGYQALEMLENHGSDIEAVLLDMVMPGMDGLEVLSRIRANDRNLHVPVIAMTSAVDLQEKILRAGANQFLAKPFEAPELIRAKIASAIANSRDTRQVMFDYLDHLPGGVFVYKAEGKQEILYANKKTLEIFECESYQEFIRLTGGTFPGLVYPEDLERTQKTIQEQVKNPDVSTQDHVIYRVKTASGTLKELDDFGNLVHDEKLGPLYYVFIGNNRITVDSARETLYDEAYEPQRVSDYRYTRVQIDEAIRVLRNVFDVVRLVDVKASKVVTIGEDGSTHQMPNNCFSVWDKSSKCENCVSARAYTLKSRETKFEFVGNETFFVMAQYLEVDEQPFIMEVVYHVRQDMVERAVGYTTFVESMRSFNEKIYEDSLTGVKNRRFYDEQMLDRECDAIAMIDVDYFKDVNDTNGHMAGDEALRAVASAIKKSIRETDFCVRFGGDEFIVGFETIPREVYVSKLEQIRREVEQVVLPDYPELKVTISVGGFYGRANVEEAIISADEALYEAKENRNNISIHGI